MNEIRASPEEENSKRTIPEVICNQAPQSDSEELEMPSKARLLRESEKEYVDRMNF